MANLIPACAVAALGALAPVASAAAGPSAARSGAAVPNVAIGPKVAHVQNGKIRLRATCPATASRCGGVILGRLPLASKPGSILDPGGLGGPFISMKPGQTIPVVFPLTPATRTFLATHPKTTLTVTTKLSDDDGNEGQSQLRVTLFAK
jgi:hypothetical protein